ncbi:MAG: phosphate acyltransferase PlsX [Mariprofundaceae bacterium]|nr:phosphate acyltransferase PlsX [Mariprofundaceae bacterium]
MRILIDGHGGDHAPDVVIEAMKLVLAKADAPTLGIVGRPDVIQPVLERHDLTDRVELVESEDIIEMCDAPALAVRRKRKSSIHVGARAVRDGEWDALVSAGNTGALMAISKLVMKTIPGIDRPAIAAMIPSTHGGTLLLDIGANVDCSSNHLIQFGVMGSCYRQAVCGEESPRVGMLNIGTEDIKGTDVVKYAAQQLAKTNLNFIGNVEGTDIFTGAVDVVVCDGFVGNIALKTMEGIVRHVLGQMKHELQSSPRAKAGAWLAMPALKNLKEALHPSEHNGAPLMGLNGVVVKSHGSADAYAFSCAIDAACVEVKADLKSAIANAMNNMTLPT